LHPKSDGKTTEETNALIEPVEKFANESYFRIMAKPNGGDKGYNNYVTAVFKTSVAN
jgi:hypothetical protein